MLETLTTSPAPRSCIRGKSAIAIRMGEKKLTSMVWFTSSTVRSSVCLRLAMAALLTAERVPRFERHRLRPLEVAQVGAPHARLGRVRQTLLEDLLEAVRPPGDDPDGRTPFRQLWRERGADPRRRARDENG